jgi:GAF domain-containing protein
MEEEILVKGDSREEKYLSLYPQIEALIKDEDDVIARMANVTAAIRQAFDFLWIGFYRVEGDSLVLGPFQGPVACSRIAYGKGVCGAAWSRAEAVIVPDVLLFDGHIACSSLSRSEIVVPVSVNDRVVAVLDVDSVSVNDFSNTDAVWLSEIIKLIY